MKFDIEQEAIWIADDLTIDGNTHVSVNKIYMECYDSVDKVVTELLKEVHKILEENKIIIVDD